MTGAPVERVLTERSGFQLDLGDWLMGGSNPFSGWFFGRIGIPTVLILTAFVALAFILLAVGFRIFIGAPLQVGGGRFFLQGARGETDLTDLASVFKSSHYLNVVKGMFLRGLYNFLWFLLLIIPGIVKHYAYRMVPYILAEKPGMDSDDAIQESMDMTRGHKLDMLVLDLSFLGWYLLGALALGIGVLFVHPYYEATYAQLYLTLKQQGYTGAVIPAPK